MGGKTVVQQPSTPTFPGPTEAETEQQELINQFLRTNIPIETKLRQQELEQVSPVITEARKLEAEQFLQLAPELQKTRESELGFLEPILRGEAPTGIFSKLTQPVQESVAFEKNRKRLLTSLSSAGLLDSGVRAELEKDLAIETSAATQATEQANLFNLLQITLGGTGSALGRGISPILGGPGVVAPGQTTGQLAQGIGTSQANRFAQAGFQQSIFQAELEAATSERNARRQQISDLFGSVAGGVGAAGGAAAFFCWVAAEIFDGWWESKTCAARSYVTFQAPKWFRNFYIKFGERIAKFIHGKPILKWALRPLFEYFAWRGK